MKITTVKKSRIPSKCVRCGRVIEKGESYRWVQAYRGPKRCFCDDCELRASDSTAGRLGEVYAAMETAYDELNAWRVQEGRDAEGLKSLMESLNEELEQLYDEYQEAADAVGENFEGSEQHSQLEEAAEGLDDWTAQINDVISDLSGFDDDVEGDETKAERDERFAGWLEEKDDEAQRAIDECPL